MRANLLAGLVANRRYLDEIWAPAMYSGPTAGLGRLVETCLALHRNHTGFGADVPMPSRSHSPGPLAGQRWDRRKNDQADETCGPAPPVEIAAIFVLTVY